MAPPTWPSPIHTTRDRWRHSSAAGHSPPRRSHLRLPVCQRHVHGISIHNLWLGWPEKRDDPSRHSRRGRKSGQALASLIAATAAEPASHGTGGRVCSTSAATWAHAGDDPLAAVRQLLQPAPCPIICRPGDGAACTAAGRRFSRWLQAHGSMRWDRPQPADLGQDGSCRRKQR